MRFGIVEKVRGKIREMREESRKVKRAKEKLRLAEEKLEAQRYVKKAKKAGVDLTEEEALALVRKEKKGSTIEKLQKFAEAFAPPSSKPTRETSKGKKGKKGKGTQKQKSVWEVLDEIGNEFADFGFKKGKGKGGDPFAFYKSFL